MAKTTEKLLAEALVNIEEAPAVRVAPDVTQDATIAIERMLDACK